MSSETVTTTSRFSAAMSKRDCFTTITPLPPQVRREAVLAFLHDYEAMIDLNPLVTDRCRIPPPEGADVDEANCIWYKLTDAIAMPWSSSSGSSSDKPAKAKPGNVSYTCVFHPLPDGLQTHCRAPLGVDIRDRWTVAGTMPGEPRQPIELGLLALGAPSTGLYLREDVDLRCNRLMAGFVKKTLKKSHATLVERLSKDLEVEEDEAQTEAGKPKRQSLSSSTGRDSEDSVGTAGKDGSLSYSASLLSTPRSTPPPLASATPSPPPTDLYPSQQQKLQARYRPYQLPSQQPQQQLQQQQQHYLQQEPVQHPHPATVPPYLQHHQNAHHMAHPAVPSSPQLWLLNPQAQGVNWSTQQHLQSQHFLHPLVLQPQHHYYHQQPLHRPMASLDAPGLYPHPLRIGRPSSSPQPGLPPQQQQQTAQPAKPQQHEYKSSQMAQSHPDYPVMNPYAGSDNGEDDDSPILGAEWRRPQPAVFAELDGTQVGSAAPDARR